MAERLQLLNRGGIVSAVVHCRISCAVPMSEGGVVEKGLLGFLGLGGVSGLGARTASGMTKADKRSVGPSPFRGRLRPLDFRYRPRATGDVWRCNMSRRATDGHVRAARSTRRTLPFGRSMVSQMDQQPCMRRQRLNTAYAQTEMAHRQGSVSAAMRSAIKRCQRRAVACGTIAKPAPPSSARSKVRAQGPPRE
jgi:hypothetical protein